MRTTITLGFRRKRKEVKLQTVPRAKKKEGGVCRLGITGFRYDESSTYMRGAADAPPRIREAFFCESSNRWSETGVNLERPELFLDMGDLFPASSKDPLGFIAEPIEKLLAHDLRPISLGGDHSITYPIITVFAKKYPKLSILHFDAHPDLYEEFQGSRYSHASPFARIMEEGLAKRLVQVGVRTINDHQRKQAERFGVEIVEMKDWRDGLEFGFDSPVYISVDIDGLDPAFAPGVSHPEPGGLSTRQVIDLIQRVEGPVVGADIVEYNPNVDVRNNTAMVCAKLFKEIAARILTDYDLVD
jgi:arginase